MKKENQFSFPTKIKFDSDKFKIGVLIFLLFVLSFGLGYLTACYQKQESLELIEGFQSTDR